MLWGQRRGGHHAVHQLGQLQAPASSCRPLAEGHHLPKPRFTSTLCLEIRVNRREMSS